MSYQHALTTLQWSTDPEKEGYGDCMEFEASKDLIKKIEDDWNSFESQALEMGFDPEVHRVESYDPSQGTLWDYVAHDFILTRNGHGSGFWDTARWAEPYATKLTELSKKFGEINIYLSDENLLEAY
jgi:hypothetical protein|tara:strand:- start:310 stop:690 length:381 start_codon:yes stop_codon:yes gene_type:complete